MQYRTAERGDTIFALDVHATAPSRRRSPQSREERRRARKAARPHSRARARSRPRLCASTTCYLARRQQTRVRHATPSTSARKNTKTSKSIVVDLLRVGARRALQPRRITKNEGEEVRPRWANDIAHIFFTIEVGDVSGPYRDLQPHLYWVDIDSGAIEQWGKYFVGPVEHYSVTANSRAGLRAPRHRSSDVLDAPSPPTSLHRLNGWPGTYAHILDGAALAASGLRLLSLWASPKKFIWPIAADKLDQARPITSFNKTLHRTRSSAGQALSMEGRRRHHRRRHADLSSGKIRSQASAHVHADSRRPRRCRRQPLRGRLVSVGRAGRDQRMARL